MFFNDITRATGLGFCLSQLPLSLFVIFYYKEPQVTAYNTVVNNKTSMTAEVSHDDLGVSVFFLAESCLIVFFSMMTSQLQDSQAIDNMVEYNEDVALQVNTWTTLLTCISCLQRFIVLGILTSPVHVAFLLLIVLSQTHAISLLCNPRSPYKKNDTFALIIYMFSLLFIFIDLRITHGIKLIVWLIQIISDTMLVIGHTYDHVCNMETVANCRIFYCCFVAVLLILLYIS